MASVEITDNTIIRSLVRKGTNDERRQITLEEGEVGYTTDTKRLFVGDGIGPGVSAGPKYLGVVNDWPASFAPQPGDFFIKDGGLYARKINLSETDNISTLSGYDAIGLAVQPGNGLVNNNGSLDVLVDNSTITFTFDNKLQVGTLTYDDLPTSESYMLLGNSDNTDKVPEEIQVNTNSVLGRISTGNIQSVTFDQILTNAVAPTIQSLKVTGLADNTSTRSLFVDSTGQLTTTSTTGSNVPLYIVSIDQSGTIRYDYNIDTVTPYNDLTTALTEFNISYIGFPATTGNSQYISADPGGFLSNSASIVTNGTSNLGIYKIVFDSPHPDYTGQMIHEASSTNFIPSRYTGNKWMTSNQPTLNLFWENSSTIWLYVSVPIFGNSNRDAKGFLVGQILSAGTPDERTRFQVKIY